METTITLPVRRTGSAVVCNHNVFEVDLFEEGHIGSASRGLGYTSTATAVGQTIMSVSAVVDDENFDTERWGPQYEATR
eukprot:2299859-Pyramimonas_sp.AAC.1